MNSHPHRPLILAEGDPAEAAESFEAVDARLGYWGGDRAGFKLFNRLTWMHTLERAGEAARAEALRRKIEAINPRFLADFQAADFERLMPGGDDSCTNASRSGQTLQPCSGRVCGEDIRSSKVGVFAPRMPAVTQHRM